MSGLRIGSRDLVLLALSILLVAPGAALAQSTQVKIAASTILDGKGGVLKDTTIVVEGSRIARLDRASADATYDLRGLTVMPGWIDTHVHIAAHFGADGRASSAVETPAQALLYAVENAHATLMAGFTTVQSLGAPSDRDLRDAIARGRIPGPRVLTSLRSITEETGDPEQIRQFVRKLAADGADAVKIFASKSIRDGGGQTLTQAQLDAACGEAKAAGLRTLVHAHSVDSIRDATLAGCTTIEHGVFADDEVLKLMAERGTFFDPHVGLLFRNYLENKPRFLGIGNYTEEGFAWMEKAIPLAVASLKRALARKVKIVFGTDAVAGAHGRNAEEIIYRVRDGGQDPMDAMVAATSRAAESLALQDRIGTIAPGLEADLIALDGDPLRDITSVRRVVFVMKGGKVYKGPASKPAGSGPR